MPYAAIRRWIPPLIGVGLLCIWGRPLLGLMLPFLLGYGLARAAEPVVRPLSRMLPRWAASGVGVAFTLVLGTGILSALGAVAVRALGRWAGAIPDLQGTVKESMQLLQDFLIRLADHTPEGIRPLLCQTVLRFFSDSSAALDRAINALTGQVGSLLGRLPAIALGLGTGILAGFLISSRLPVIRQAVRSRTPDAFRDRYLPMARKFRKALGRWLLAQGELALITYCVVCAGLLLLHIPYGPAWAVPVALVDAVPMLGTGTVLVPWALVMLLQSRPGAALGLLGIYGTALITRTVLEPKLLGRQLGLDPLVTLFFLYLGFRFWGFWGMLLFPMTAGAIRAAAA